LKKFLFHIALFLGSSTLFAQNSVLKDGLWYKIAIEKNGVYRLTPEQLGKMGFNTAEINPHDIRIFGYLNGMLPQSNEVPRPDDLIELGIYVEGEGDGKFDNADYILFYADGPGTTKFIPGKNVFSLQTNLYSDKNFYFVTVGGDSGKRIPARPAGTGGALVRTYHDYIFHETNSVNILRSGREWFGENFELDQDQTFEFNVPGIAEGSEITVVSEVMGQSFNPSSFELFFNGHSIGEQVVPIIPDSQYSAKGRLRRDTIRFNASEMAAPGINDQTLRYNFKRASSRKSVGFLNFFSIHVERDLDLSQDQVIFRNGNTLNSNSRFSVSNVTAADHIWNISDPYSPALQQFELNNHTASFSSTAGETCEEFIIFKSNVPSPELIGKVQNQDLHGMSTPNLLIVTHPELLDEANRLADHRRSHSNISVIVVTTEQVYNEFSSGRQDITAIRDFVRSLYVKSPDALKSLLLFGKSSYDYKDRVQNNLNLVPTYESRNSLFPLETFSSDDYFAFMETSEGEWEESVFESHSLDLGVGRLPVKSSAEARIVVDKIIQYDLNGNKFGQWKKDFVFVADDGSNSDSFSSIHQSQSNSMAENIESDNQQFNTRKIFLGSYSKKVSPNGETIPEANRDIMEEFDNAVIINYTGHGSEKLWADEHVFSGEEINKLRNKSFPFLVTATCEFGKHDDPNDISSAENSLLKDNAGSIGLVTTTRPVNSSTNFELNQAFYEALFHRSSGRWLTLGEVFRHTKNNSTSGVANRNFSLLADPGMTLALPLQTVVIDHIKTENGSDTLKALSKVIVRGRVTNNDGFTDENFSGTLQTTLFDKRTKFQTIGKNDPAFKYSQWFNPLFRGQASVSNGEFEFSFVLPKNIAYEVGSGKLSLYAMNTAKTIDATGGASSFKIGQSEHNPPADITSPFIQAFMGDSTFMDGGTVSQNSTLVVRLKDQSGLNVSNYGIGNTMMATLDDDAAVFLINEHYMADKDNYTQGWVHFPLYDLVPGKHSMTVKAWDAFNNPAETIIHFNVSDENSLTIGEFANYPNPFHEETTLFFTHNRPGEDLVAYLSIVNLAGMEITSYNVDIAASSYMVNLTQFEGVSGFEKKLSPGLYFARLRVRSVTDGTESAAVTKLIFAN
jgi:hypothetical protein